MFGTENDMLIGTNHLQTAERDRKVELSEKEIFRQLCLQLRICEKRKKKQREAAMLQATPLIPTLT